MIEPFVAGGGKAGLNEDITKFTNKLRRQAGKTMLGAES